MVVGQPQQLSKRVSTWALKPTLEHSCSVVNAQPFKYSQKTPSCLLCTADVASKIHMLAFYL